MHDPNAHNEVFTPSVGSAGSDSQTASEITLQTRTTVAYGMHIMHVLHILLTGKWDPIAILDDNDLWISSQSFVTATGHAVSAAEAVADVIEYDPDLSFMPFFFGIYLLQGSFLLLLFADKLQGDVSPDVVRACETIVRAHEACVATLDTQYQASSPMLLGVGNANGLTAKLPQGDAFSAAAGPRQNPAGSRGTATVEERGVGFVSVDW